MPAASAVAPRGVSTKPRTAAGRRRLGRQSAAAGSFGMAPSRATRRGRHRGAALGVYSNFGGNHFHYHNHWGYPGAEPEEVKKPRTR